MTIKITSQIVMPYCKYLTLNVHHKTLLQSATFYTLSLLFALNLIALFIALGKYCHGCHKNSVVNTVLLRWNLCSETDGYVALNKHALVLVTIQFVTLISCTCVRDP